MVREQRIVKVAGWQFLFYVVSLLASACILAVKVRGDTASITGGVEVKDARNVLQDLLNKGDYHGIVQYASQSSLLEAFDMDTNDDATVDYLRSSDGHDWVAIHQYVGVASYHLGYAPEAIRAFQLATRVMPDYSEPWLSLGHSFLLERRLGEASLAFAEAVINRNLTNSPGNVMYLLHSRTWLADWRDEQWMTDLIRRHIEDSIKAGTAPEVDTMQYTDVSNAHLLWIAKHQPPSRIINASPLCTEPLMLLPSPGSNRYRVGFISSDLGRALHPMSTLLRGMLTSIDKERFEIYIYSLTEGSHWWLTNITEGVDHMVPIHDQPQAKAAALIASHKLHSLIDLNGFTIGSGLPILASRPAPLQYSFMGYPITTGTSYIDYFISDWVASTPEMSAHYSEQLALLPPSYIVSDFNAMFGHVINAIPPPARLSATPIRFASYSRFNKVNSLVYTVWMNILRRTGDLSTLTTTNYRHWEDAVPNLQAESAGWGVDPSRLITEKPWPWQDYIMKKSEVDLVLDTFVKNGHTTGLESLWGSVPVLTLPLERMETRATASFYDAMDFDPLVVHSVKEYEDLAVQLALDPALLHAIKEEVGKRRVTTALFDTEGWTKQFEDMLLSASEARATEGCPWPLIQEKRPIERHVRLGSYSYDAQGLRKAHASSEPVLLYVGPAGQVPTSSKHNWTSVDVRTDGASGQLGIMDGLSEYGTGTVTAICAAHVLQRVPHNSKSSNVSVSSVLKEWHRALVNGGLALITVPDLEALARLLVKDSLSVENNISIVRAIYGEQVTDADFNRSGFTETILVDFLNKAGFCQIRRVELFNLFTDDATRKAQHDRPPDLNVVATACKEQGSLIQVELQDGDIVVAAKSSP